MGDFIGLNPVVILICLLAGGQIAGLLGIIISVPIAGTIKGTIDTMRQQQQQSQAINIHPEFAGESVDSE
jgi:predicted PurR-regulated permease PerM